LFPREFMKRSAQKSNTLSLVPADPQPQCSGVRRKSTVLKESFDSWLGSVAPTLLQTPAPPESSRSVTERWRSSLTARDVTRVNRATVRESSDHRHWPPEVVITFLAAEVIKRRDS
jgi:hypothetical protein